MFGRDGEQLCLRNCGYGDSPKENQHVTTRGTLDATEARSNLYELLKKLVFFFFKLIILESSY